MLAIADYYGLDLVAPTIPYGLWQSVNMRNSIRNSGAYSDMTICLSDGTKVECHRAIMCARCDFFRIALESGFKVCLPKEK